MALSPQNAQDYGHGSRTCLSNEGSEDFGNSRSSQCLCLSNDKSRESRVATFADLNANPLFVGLMRYATASTASTVPVPGVHVPNRRIS